MELAGVKPKLRGVFHLFGFFAALVGAFFLVLAPAEGAQYAAGVLYGASLSLMLGLSALYHRPTWSHAARKRMRKLDHAGIFGLIAGTFTPLAVLHGKGAWTGWLTVMWSLALAGIVFVVAWTYAPRGLRAGIYVALGLMAAPVLFALPTVIGLGRLSWLLAGSGVYIAGALVYARRWPNPQPAIFGYHEIFHLMVLLAAATHYAVVLDLQFR